MTRLFTRVLCSKCGEHYTDKAYTINDKEVVEGECFACTITNIIREERRVRNE